MNSNQEQLVEFVLRDAAGGDLAAINDIYNHYVRTSTCTYQVEPDTVSDREAWFREHGPDHPVIVAEMKREILGWGSLSPWGSSHSRDAYRFTVEDSIYVRHDMHRRGIGGAILAELIRRAQRLRYRSILASISADRTASILLHEKFGFSKAAHLQEVGLKFDKWLDVVFLQKML